MEDWPRENVSAHTPTRARSHMRTHTFTLSLTHTYTHTDTLSHTRRFTEGCVQHFAGQRRDVFGDGGTREEDRAFVGEVVAIVVQEIICHACSRFVSPKRYIDKQQRSNTHRARHLQDSIENRDEISCRNSTKTS